MTDASDHPQKKKTTDSQLLFQSIALGVVIGAGAGVAMDNVAVGTAIGVALGLALDSVGRRGKKSDEDASSGTHA